MAKAKVKTAEEMAAKFRTCEELSSALSASLNGNEEDLESSLKSAKAIIAKSDINKIKNAVTAESKPQIQNAPLIGPNTAYSAEITRFVDRCAYLEKHQLFPAVSAAAGKAKKQLR